MVQNMVFHQPESPRVTPLFIELPITTHFKFKSLMLAYTVLKYSY